jgi:hypothetical protein
MTGPVAQLTRSRESARTGRSTSTGSKSRELALDFHGMTPRTFGLAVSVFHTAQQFKGMAAMEALIFVNGHRLSLDLF